MTMKLMLAIVGLVGWSVLGANAQMARPVLWRAEFPGGNYSVSLAAISSVSTHEYVVDRAVKVFEMTINTNGAVVARFYSVEPIKPNAPGGYGQGVVDKVQEKVQDGVQRVTGETNEPLLSSVIKNYPTTTHAHTVEYRLPTRDDVVKAFKSVEGCWRTGQEGTYKP